MQILAHKNGLQFLLAHSEEATKATLIDFERMQRYDGIGVQSAVKYGGWDTYSGPFSASEILRMLSAKEQPWEKLPQMQEPALIAIISDSGIRLAWCRYYYLAKYSESATTAAEATARAWERFRKNYVEVADGEWKRRL